MNDRSKLRQSLLREPATLAGRAGALRWSGLFKECLEDRRREFVADSLEADFANHALVWFGK